MVNINDNNYDIFIGSLRENIASKFQTESLKSYVSNEMSEQDVFITFLEKEKVKKFKVNFDNGFVFENNDIRISLSEKLITEKGVYSDHKLYPEFRKVKEVLVKKRFQAQDIESKIHNGTASSEEKEFLNKLNNELKNLGSRFNDLKDKMSGKTGSDSGNYSSYSWSDEERRRYQEAQERVRRYAKEYAEYRRKEELVSTALAISYILGVGLYFYYFHLRKLARICNKKYPSGSMMWFDCIKSEKKKALKAEIIVLERGKSKCKESKNPDKCVEKINERIAKLKRKLHK